MKKSMVLLCAMVLVIGVSSIVSADLIDFEVGFSDRSSVGTVITSSNEVSFWVTDGGTAYITKVGYPHTAFLPNDDPQGDDHGSFFLTDQPPPEDQHGSFDYFMSFAFPVLNLNLDLYDYRREGHTYAGDTATLTVFSDLNMTSSVGADIFTVSNGLPDGNVATLSITNPFAPILSASLTFSASDGGTGIDNIQFTTVPEPTTMLLLGSGLLGLAGFRKRLGRVNKR